MAANAKKKVVKKTAKKKVAPKHDQDGPSKGRVSVAGGMRHRE